ncbi:NAD-dependent epimerase/dehydratase family protein [Opitutaceae bacterium]|nr:NAD-dependent epimerase/dehydratase family protein [Opitutaceae bacterium]
MSDAPTGPVLVTGGTGFLGSHLVDRLLETGRTVTVVSRSPQPKLEARGIRVVVGPLHDPDVCTAAVEGAETVFHVAARVGVWGRYEDFYRDNVVSTETLLAAAQKAEVRRFVHTSTPSVVYNGQDLAGADESLPLTNDCPSPYPLTKAQAEAKVLAANRDDFQTIALRPHLIWGVGDPHLVPRILARARAGKLRIVGSGQNRVDMVHITNATQAHLNAESALANLEIHCHLASDNGTEVTGGDGFDKSTFRGLGPAGRAFFITNDEPVNLWDWVNELLVALDEPPLTKSISLKACETMWKILPLNGEPPMTRFIAAELAKDHWFDLTAAKRDLGYQPTISMSAGTAELIEHLRTS